MSTPNPLRRYRSSQYHHILIVAPMDVLQKIDADLDVHDLSRFSRPDSDPSKAYDAKSSGGGSYCILYNSMVDGAFSVDSLVLDYHLQASESGTSSTAVSTSAGTSLKIDIIEPYTADFITALEVCAINSGQTLKNCYIGVKTIFVGFQDDANSNKPHIIHTVNTIPFSIHTLELSVSPKYTKYDLECFPLINKAADNPNMTKIGGVSFTTPEPLSEAIKKLETELNKKSEETKKANPEDNIYKYKIILDSAYKDPKYKIDNVNKDQQSTNGVTPPAKVENTIGIPNNTDQKHTSNDKDKKPEPNIFNIPVNGTAKTAINTLMLSSKGVMDDVNNVDKTDPDNPTTSGYIINTVPKVLENGDQEVKYIIVKVAEPKATDKPMVAASTTDDTKLPETLEYDYIYTGKNIDILQFDMNVKLFLHLIPSINVVNPDPSIDNKTQTNDSKSTNNSDAPDTAGEHRDFGQSKLEPNTTKEPAGPKSPNTMDPMRIGSGALHPSAVFAARKNLSIAVSQALTDKSCMLKIVGNPLLLAGYTPPADLFETQGEGSDNFEQIKQAMEKHKEKTGASLTSIPKVKINIRVPKPSYMQGTAYGKDDNYYSSPFWEMVSGYLLLKISSRFSKGEFTQVLELRAIPYGPGTTTSTVPAEHPPKGEEAPSDKQQPSTTPETPGDNVKAFLDMISHAEGTYGHGDNGYNVRWGGTLFNSYTTHPWHVQEWSSKDGKKHSPAGRYQILVGTYDANVAKCGGDFSPASQDKIAIFLLKYRKAYDLVVAGKPAEAIKKLPNEWSSLRPSVHSEATLLKWYEQHGGTYQPQTSSTASGTQSGSRSTSPNANQNGSASNPAGVDKLNNGLTSGTQDAINKGVKYQRGSRNTDTGSVDCSGWVLENTGKSVAGMNDPNATDGYNLMKKGGTAAGIVQSVGNASGNELTGSDVNTGTLKPGMVIGIDYSQSGANSGQGRYKGIDHIVQVVQDPNSGKLQISESSSGAHGVRVQDADKWLANKKGKPMYAVDPFYKMR